MAVMFLDLGGRLAITSQFSSKSASLTCMEKIEGFRFALLAELT